MKKVLATVLTLTLLICMVGCSSDKDNKDKSKENPTTTTPTADNTSGDGLVTVESLAGKTLQEAIDAGYSYGGYSSMGSDIELMLISTESSPEAEQLLSQIKDKTVAELVAEYDISLGYSGWEDEYTFSTSIGSVNFEFELENGVAALKAHDSESFFDLEKAEEVQNDKLNNIKITYTYLTATLDTESDKKLKDLEDFDSDVVEEMASELVIRNAFFTVK